MDPLHCVLICQGKGSESVLKNTELVDYSIEFDVLFNGLVTSSGVKNFFFPFVLCQRKYQVTRSLSHSFQFFFLVKFLIEIHKYVYWASLICLMDLACVCQESVMCWYGCVLLCMFFLDVFVGVVGDQWLWLLQKPLKPRSILNLHCAYKLAGYKVVEIEIGRGG